MDSHDKSWQRRVRPASCRLLAVASLSVMCLPGCSWTGRIGSINPFRQRPDPVFASDATAEHIVRHINSSVARSWRTSDASLSVKGPGGIPLRLPSTTIAVEAPNRLRLVANSMAASVDLGSNDERFWCWFRPDRTPTVYTVKHQDADMVQSCHQIPFKPDWLMEVLGVTPLEGPMQLHREAPRSRLTNLVSHYETPGGQYLRRVIKVDLVLGKPVEHQLIDSEGELVARARLSDYTEGPSACIPRRIQLEWPQTKFAMTIRLGRVHLNSDLPRDLWTLPDKRCPIVDLGDGIRRDLDSRFPQHAPGGLGGSDRAYPLIADETDGVNSESPYFGPEPQFDDPPARTRPVAPGRRTASTFAASPAGDVNPASFDEPEASDEPPWADPPAMDDRVVAPKPAHADENPFAPFE